MFTSKDIESRTIFVINCINERNLRVSSGEMLLEEPDTKTGKMRTLTKMPFQKILAIFVIGHISITTPLIEKCKRFGVALLVVKPNWRPVFYWSGAAEANFLLRKKQYEQDEGEISIAKFIVRNKIENQLKMLEKTRRKDTITSTAIKTCDECLNKINFIEDYNALMGVEGISSKSYFKAYFNDFEWQGRRPRTKCDELNVVLDIGYTILFNFTECFIRMFGFDLYKGTYHRLWFKRKSLVCDIMEPFRCIIDNTVRSAIHRKQIQKKDFICVKNEYMLKREENAKYYQMFFNALITYKKDMFIYVQKYYRCFMKGFPYSNYPQFTP